MPISIEKDENALSISKICRI